MALQRITILSSCLIFSVLGTACDLGEKSIGNDPEGDRSETGGPDEGDPGDGNGEGTGFGGGCGEETVTIIDDLDAALPGFDGTATEYLALLEGTFLGELAWQSHDGPVTIAHAGTTSSLTVDVVHQGGEVRLTEVELVGEFPDDELGGDLCSNALELDVILGFATEDGLFAESFAVPVRLHSEDESSPGFYFSLDADALAGQLSRDDFELADGEVSGLVLVGSFDDDSVKGGLMMEVTFMDWAGFGSAAGFEATRAP